MKITLKLIKKNNLHLLFCIIILLILTINGYSSENKIIFKINEKAFTSLDLEKRKEYLDFVGSNENIDDKVIINDFISANLFFEHYMKLNNNNVDEYKTKIKEIFDKIYNTNKKINKKYNYEISNDNILKNIEIDYIRKIILENIFNSSVNDIITSDEEIDLLYNITIRYINLKTTEINKLRNDISNLKNNNYETIINFLNKNNFEYFTKEKEINNINKIDERVKENILSNNNFFIIEKDNVISMIFIEKYFETLDGIIALLYSVTSKNEIDNAYLDCKNLKKFDDNQNIIKKEYKFIDLNTELKNNLVSINDYVKYLSDGKNIYIVLCDIKFDKEILNNFNFNKIVNFNISKIEEKFINKYSKIYNLITFDE